MLRCRPFRKENFLRIELPFWAPEELLDLSLPSTFCPMPSSGPEVFTVLEEAAETLGAVLNRRDLTVSTTDRRRRVFLGQALSSYSSRSCPVCKLTGVFCVKTSRNSSLPPLSLPIDWVVPLMDVGPLPMSGSFSSLGEEWSTLTGVDKVPLALSKNGPGEESKFFSVRWNRKK